MEVKTMPLGAYQTNCYLAWGDSADSCVVIDPGYTPEIVLSEAKKQNKTIAAVLLTHGHFDHVGGVRELAERVGCPVYLHEQELSLPESFTAGPLYYTDTYGEGDVLELSNLSIRVLHTPGHTPGSVCLLTEGTVFAGDTLFQNSIGRTDFPGGSFTQMQNSLNLLAAMPGNYRVLPGHGAATTLDEERKYNPYLR